MDPGPLATVIQSYIMCIKAATASGSLAHESSQRSCEVGAVIFPHFTKRETEAQRGPIICLQHNSGWMGELGFKPGLPLQSQHLIRTLSVYWSQPMGPLHGLSAWTPAEGPGHWPGGLGAGEDNHSAPEGQRTSRRPWRRGGWKSVNMVIQHRCSPYECRFKKTSAQSRPRPGSAHGWTGPRQRRAAPGRL